MNVLLGLAMIVAGVGGCIAEYRHPPVHPWLLGGYGGVALFGALVIRPDPMFDRLSRLGKTVGPYLPSWKKDP